jgi:prolyl-tRNA editing enzyme YbaK/EbsC (Cys-tRNA(Pro) deacylase)
MVRDYREFDLGAVPPIGGGRRDPVVVDRRLVERDSIVLEAGSHEHSARVPTGDPWHITEPRSATNPWTSGTEPLVVGAAT